MARLREVGETLDHHADQIGAEADAELRTRADVRSDRQTHGAFCTLECFGDGDCDSRAGLGLGVCIQWTGDDAAFCYQRCAGASDCYPSSACETILLDGEPIDVCLPDRL